MLDFKTANTIVGYWDNTLYAWYTVYFPKEEKREIQIKFDKELVPALDKLVQNLFNRGIYPVFDRTRTPEEFFPLSREEEHYLFIKWHSLIHVCSESEVMKALEKVLDE